MTAAATILAQFGGHRLIAMTGAKCLVDHGDALSFKFAGGMKHRRGKPNYCKVTLDTASDTYSVEFGRLTKRGLEYRQLATFDGVYCDMLIQLFEDQTGLYLRL